LHGVVSANGFIGPKTDLIMEKAAQSPVFYISICLVVHGLGFLLVAIDHQFKGFFMTKTTCASTAINFSF